MSEQDCPPYISDHFVAYEMMSWFFPLWTSSHRLQHPLVEGQEAVVTITPTRNKSEQTLWALSQ